MYRCRCRPDGDPKGIQGSDHNLTQLKPNKLSIPARCFQRIRPAAFLGAWHMLRQLSHVKNSSWSIVEGDHITSNGDCSRLAAKFFSMLNWVIWVMHTARTWSANQFSKCRRLPSSITPTRILTAPSAGHSFDIENLENCFGMFWAIFCLIRQFMAVRRGEVWEDLKGLCLALSACRGRG